MQNVESHKIILYLCIGIIALGGFFRAKHYIDNNSLWSDECYLALDIATRSFSDIIDNQSTLPLQPKPSPGYLVVVKLMTKIFGDNELALRAISFFCGISALILFYILLKQYISGYALLIGLSIFAIAKPLIYFSAEIKPYSTDVFAAILLYLIYAHVVKRGFLFSSSFGLIILGALIMWFSYASLFILSAIGFVLLLRLITMKERKYALVLGFCILVWGASFFVLYTHSIKGMLGNDYLLGSWVYGFMPANASWGTKLSWVKDSLLNMFSGVTGIASTVLAGVLFMAGAYQLIKEDVENFFLLNIPLALALSLAILHKYPFYERMILFLAPALCVGISRGVTLFLERKEIISRIGSTIIVAILLIQPLQVAFAYTAKTYILEDMRPIMEHLKTNYKKGDAVFLNNSAQYAFGYYHGALNFFQDQLLVGKLVNLVGEKGNVGIKINYEYHNYDEHGYLRGITLNFPPYNLLKNDIKWFAHNKRSWFVISHFDKELESWLVHRLDSVGRRDFMQKGVGASLYLYDLSEISIEGENLTNGATYWIME